MARQERGENGKERTIASCTAGRGRASPCRTWGRWCGRQQSIWRRGRRANRPRAGAGRSPARTRLPKRPGSVTAMRFSDAVSIQIPSVVPAGARKPYFIFGDSQNSVNIWFFDLARPNRLHHGKGNADMAPTEPPRGISPASRATTRENGRSSSSGPLSQRRARSSRLERSCRSPSRSGTGSRASVATSGILTSLASTSSRKWSHRPSARC